GVIDSLSVHFPLNFNDSFFSKSCDLGNIPNFHSFRQEAAGRCFICLLSAYLLSSFLSSFFSSFLSSLFRFLHLKFGLTLGGFLIQNSFHACFICLKLFRCSTKDR